ncbi:hypothetical protein BHM03_00033530 [Ensete ventricosum]|nr:hypothetical protein BHM03_00033530 [Ensete ventricosum]
MYRNLGEVPRKACSFPEPGKPTPHRGCVPSKIIPFSVPIDRDIKLDHSVCPQQMPRNNRFKDKRYDSFKTWSGKLERQISTLRGKPQEPEEVNDSKKTKPEAVPADRFFDALEGPELDKLKVLF